MLSVKSNVVTFLGVDIGSPARCLLYRGEEVVNDNNNRAAEVFSTPEAEEEEGSAAYKTVK